MLAFPIEYFKKAITTLILQEEKIRFENLIPLFELWVIYFIGEMSFLRAATLWITMHSMSGYWLIFTSLIASHHHPDIYHAGDTPRYTGLGCSNLFIDVPKVRNFICSPPP